MAQGRHTLMDPPIEELLDKVDSKFTLVALGSARARQVNSYYNSLGEGLGKVVPPQVASVSGKPVSIAFEEIAAGKATFTRPDPEEEAALAAAIADAAEAGLLAEAEAAPTATETRRSDRGARRRGRRPGCELGAGRTGAASSADGRRPRNRGPAGDADRAPHAAPRVVLGVCGGIAAYKAVEVCRQLVDAGVHVTPILTEEATRFVGAVTFSALASEPVQRSLWDEASPIPAHQARASRPTWSWSCRRRRTPSPATPPGSSDDLLCATLLATRAPVHRLPRHAHRDVGARVGAREPRHARASRRRGHPARERTAGRRRLGRGPAGRPRRDRGPRPRTARPRRRGATCTGVRVVVSAGGTREPLDPVRFITNRSSGKQGHAIAVAAAPARRGGHARHVLAPRAPARRLVGGDPDRRGDGGRHGARGRRRGRGCRRRGHGGGGGRLPPEAVGGDEALQGGRPPRAGPRADARHPGRTGGAAAVRDRSWSGSRPRPTTRWSGGGASSPARESTCSSLTT